MYSQSFIAGGYAKFLFNANDFISPRSNVNFMLHSRLNLKFYPTDKINLNAGIRNRIIIGKSPLSIMGYTGNGFDDEYFLKLDRFIWKKEKSVNHIEVDRLYLSFQFSKFDVSLGRQRIAWGTSWVWNITDLFNPLSILDFDYEEKPAVDAFRFQFFISPLSKFDFAYKPSKRGKNSSMLFQFSTNFYRWDFNILSGVHKSRFVLGASYAGDIYGAGFRGEVIYVKNPIKINVDFITDLANEKRDQISFVVSLDYTFKNSFYLHGEALFNNIGKRDKIQMYLFDALKLGLLSPSRWNLFYQVGYNLTELARGDVIILHNPIDGSFVILPMVNISIVENLDLSLILLLMHGDDLDEYGFNTYMFFLRWKYSF
jgi:hypothetical protein